MSYSKIESALIQAVVNLNLNVPTSYPNQRFEPPSPTSKWAKVSIAPAQPSVGSLGLGGEDEITGIMQLDLYHPKDTGTYDLNQQVDSTRAYFYAGRYFTFNGQFVLIQSCGLGPVGYDGPFLRGIVTIEWESRLVRPLS